MNSITIAGQTRSLDAPASLEETFKHHLNQAKASISRHLVSTVKRYLKKYRLYCYKLLKNADSRAKGIKNWITLRNKAVVYQRQLNRIQENVQSWIYKSLAKYGTL